MSEDAATLFEKLGFTPGKVIRLFGMRRSGNHAIVNWLQRNAGCQTVFLNNCVPGQCAFESLRALEINGDRCPVRKGTDIGAMTRAAPDGTLLIISYEDDMPDPDADLSAITPGLPTEAPIENIILFRSFMNWTASLLRKLQVNDQDVLDRLRIMVVAIDRYRDALELALKKLPGFTPVHYDRWVARPRYRRNLLDRFGLEAHDNSLGDVQTYGGGSSFQKDVSKVDELELNDRWRLMVNEPDYQIVLLAVAQDKELVDLVAEITPKDGELLNSYVQQARFPYHVDVTEDA